MVSTSSALSPTPPFHPNRARMKIAAFIMPLVFLTALVKSAVVVKCTGAVIGFVFFGQPVIDRGVEWLDDTFPDWKRVIELRK